MTSPFKAATIRQSFGDNMKPRFIVMIDQDAAEIMGETKLRYVYDNLIGAERFAAVLQSNLDELHAEACE